MTSKRLSLVKWVSHLLKAASNLLKFSNMTKMSRQNSRSSTGRAHTLQLTCSLKQHSKMLSHQIFRATWPLCSPQSCSSPLTASSSWEAAVQFTLDQLPLELPYFVLVCHMPDHLDLHSTLELIQPVFITCCHSCSLVLESMICSLLHPLSIKLTAWRALRTE